MPPSCWTLRWPLHPGLEASSRVLWCAREGELTSREVAILLGIGAIAAVGTSLLDLPLRIPGHAILRTMLPLAVGFALVPRRHAGAVMSGGALFSLLILLIGGGRLPGIGSTTSLLLTGPLIDRAVRSARQGWQVHTAFALAGLASNTCRLRCPSHSEVPRLGRTGRAVFRQLAAAGIMLLCRLRFGGGLARRLDRILRQRGKTHRRFREAHRMIYVGLDDTDMPSTPGTNQLAKALATELAEDYRCTFVLRHQLLQDSRIASTRHNSAATLCLTPQRGPCSSAALIKRLSSFLNEHAVVGSDPGLCVAGASVPRTVQDYGRRCQNEVTDQNEARRIARDHGIHLAGLAGTEDGVIGALAAVGLASTGADGRIVQIDGQDDLATIQPVPTLRQRGVECRCLASGRVIADGLVDVGKHLRPNFRRHRAVLFIESAAGDCASPNLWKAARLP